eukprot:16110356-Heterocapsa_arctica.AAC.1
MPDNIGWLPAIAEPSQRKGKGKGKSKTSSDGTPLWPKQTKAAVQQGQMAILCCQDQEGKQFFWT